MLSQGIDLDVLQLVSCPLLCRRDEQHSLLPLAALQAQPLLKRQLLFLGLVKGKRDDKSEAPQIFF